MHQNIRILTWFNFFTDFKLYAPIAIIYFAQVSGSFALGMSVFSIAMVSSALFEVPTGIFSDLIGRKRTIILGSVFATFCAVFYAIGQSFWVLAIGALLEGLSRSFYSGNNDALLYDTLLEKNETNKYAEFLGKTSKMFQLALALSAIIAGLILINGTFSIVLWLSVIPQVLCFVLALFLIEPKVRSSKSGNIYAHLKEAINGFRHNKKLRLLSLTSILGTGFGEASYQFHSAFFVTVWPLWAVPFAKVISNVGAAVSFHYSGRIINKFNVFKILLLGQVYTRGVVILSAAISSVLSPILYSSTSLFYGVLVVGRNSLMQKEFKQEQRATMGSLDSFAGSILFGIVAFCMGLIADKLSPAQAIISVQLFLAVNIIIFYKLFKSYSKDNPHP